jgi:tRNA nucleotidyltransferase (CCA-adding enzyme)
LRRALQAAQGIDAATVARDAEPGRIREAIFQARVNAVSAWRKHWQGGDQD